MACHILGTGIYKEEDVTPWIASIRAAIDRISENETRSWQAIISQDPARIDSGLIVLDETTSIGEMVFDAASRPYFELVNGSNLNSVTHAATFPIHVRGSSTGYSYESCMHEARKSLKLLCSLISLVTRQTWLLRYGPDTHMLADGTAIDGLFPMPEYSIYYPEEAKGLSRNFPVAPLVITKEIADSWSAVMTDKILREALHTYHEALLLFGHGHESYGLVALVGVVEHLGKDGLEGKHKFGDALKVALGPELAEEYQKMAYGLRSTTAHGGPLHANEVAFGRSELFELLADHKAQQFGEVKPVLQVASVRLLRKRLSLE
ncbi:hypothetical protein SAMN04487818_107335 [Actinokineospora terrae]|uniref:Apea-like HEPN domain-containing protein n=1 Tax=Actinokineospora terrae TaxID=155974 RepID=A0A1H9ULI2_9PSEU|nr:hypothetical protein SAMN04487818_107335 [Actinokineospora terrae]